MAICETAFRRLKGILITTPVLAFADFNLLLLYTEASNWGLGAVLTQKQGEQEQVIAYMSRSLHPAEKNDEFKL